MLRTVAGRAACDRGRRGRHRVWKVLIDRLRALLPLTLTRSPSPSPSLSPSPSPSPNPNPDPNPHQDEIRTFEGDPHPSSPFEGTTLMDVVLRMARRGEADCPRISRELLEMTRAARYW